MSSNLSPHVSLKEVGESGSTYHPCCLLARSVVCLYSWAFMASITPPFPEKRLYKHINHLFFRKLAKSTLVLIPMFGVHAIVFIGMPDNITSGIWWDIRMYFDLFFNSFQVISPLLVSMSGWVMQLSS